MYIFEIKLKIHQLLKHSLYSENEFEKILNWKLILFLWSNLSWWYFEIKFIVRIGAIDTKTCFCFLAVLVRGQQTTAGFGQKYVLNRKESHLLANWTTKKTLKMFGPKTWCTKNLSSIESYETELSSLTRPRVLNFD